MGGCNEEVVSEPMKYPVAALWKAQRREGVHAGTMMGFVRLLDTTDRRISTLYDPGELVAWVPPMRRVCLIGTDPLSMDVRALLFTLDAAGVSVHVETSGTQCPEWLDPTSAPRSQGMHCVGVAAEDGGILRWGWMPLWVAVSPTIGYRPEIVGRVADEVRVVVGGSNGPGWPSIDDAVRWADMGKRVYLVPGLDGASMDDVLAAAVKHPELTVSAPLDLAKAGVD